MMHSPSGLFAVLVALAGVHVDRLGDDRSGVGLLVSTRWVASGQGDGQQSSENDECFHFESFEEESSLLS